MFLFKLGETYVVAIYSQIRLCMQNIFILIITYYQITTVIIKITNQNIVIWVINVPTYKRSYSVHCNFNLKKILKVYYFSYSFNFKYFAENRHIIIEAGCGRCTLSRYNYCLMINGHIQYNGIY